MKNRMKKEFELSFKIMLRLLVVVFLVDCQGSTNLIGTWQEIGSKATNDNDLVLISSDTGETEKYRKIKQ
jgi:hypothetical protein